MFADLNSAEDQLALALGSGQGSCQGDGTGLYKITSIQGQGVLDTWDVSPTPLTFDMTVSLQIRRLSDGHRRTIAQDWSGVLSYPRTVFTVSNAASAAQRIPGGLPGAGTVQYGRGDHVTIDWVF